MENYDYKILKYICEFENERYKYNSQLKSAEVWKERIFGFLFGVFATVAAELIIRYL